MRAQKPRLERPREVQLRTWRPRPRHTVQRLGRGGFLVLADVPQQGEEVLGVKALRVHLHLVEVDVLGDPAQQPGFAFPLVAPSGVARRGRVIP